MNDLSVNDYLTNLETDKEELVNNLNERGVDASTDETFTSLTKKVKTIGEGSMPYATEDIAGVIKVGKNLKMDNDGKLNASFDDYPTYEVILTTDFLTDTRSGGRGLSGNDRDAIWDMYHWAEEISQVSDYCVTYTFKNQPCHNSIRTFKKYLTHFYPKGTLPTDYLFSVCFGYYANGAIINGHGKTIGGISVAHLYFRFDTSNVISLAVSYDTTGEHLVNTYALAKDNTGEYTPTGDYHPTTKLYVDTKINEVGIQFIEMPEASAEYSGKVLQYIGETAAPYIKGHFYTCISDKAEEPTYQWTEISLGGGGSGDEKYYSYKTVVNWISVPSSLKIAYSDYKNECLAKNAILPIRININHDNNAHRRIVVYVYPYYNASKKVEGYSGVAITAGNYGSMEGMQFYIKSTSMTPFDKIEDIPSDGEMTIVISNLKGGLSTNNTSAYTPTSNYHPATKKYVDDQIGNINAILATLVDIEEGE